MKSNKVNEPNHATLPEHDEPSHVFPAGEPNGAGEDEQRTSSLLFGGAYPIPETVLVVPPNDYLSGMIDYLPPRPRRPFDNTVSDAMNAIDLTDDCIERFFMLKEPSDEVIDGASSALIYVLSELHEEDANFMGLLGGAIARFAQCIPQLEHMIDTTEMDRHAKLKPG